LDLLRRLTGNSDLPAPQIVVAPVRSVLQPQVKGLGELKPIRLAVGDEIDLMDLASALVGAAYTRVGRCAGRLRYTAQRRISRAHSHSRTRFFRRRPHCIGAHTERQRAAFAERARQARLAASRGERHVGASMKSDHRRQC